MRVSISQNKTCSLYQYAIGQFLEATINVKISKIKFRRTAAVHSWYFPNIYI